MKAKLLSLTSIDTAQLVTVTSKFFPSPSSREKCLVTLMAAFYHVIQSKEQKGTEMEDRDKRK